MSVLLALWAPGAASLRDYGSNTGFGAVSRRDNRGFQMGWPEGILPSPLSALPAPAPDTPVPVLSWACLTEEPSFSPRPSPLVAFAEGAEAVSFDPRPAPSLSS